MTLEKVSVKIEIAYPIFWTTHQFYQTPLFFWKNLPPPRFFFLGGGGGGGGGGGDFKNLNHFK